MSIQGYAKRYMLIGSYIFTALYPSKAGIVIASNILKASKIGKL